MGVLSQSFARDRSTEMERNAAPPGLANQSELPTPAKDRNLPASARGTGSIKIPREATKLGYHNCRARALEPSSGDC